MADKMHDVVKLLLKRMESHPEEFGRGSSRWGWMVEGVLTNCSEEERAALHAGLRPIRLNQLHEDVMDELLGGPERRAEEQSMGASLRSALHPGVQQIDMEMKHQDVTRVSQYPTSIDMEYNGIFNAIRNIMK